MPGDAPSAGHNVGGVAADRLRSIVDRIERGDIPSLSDYIAAISSVEFWSAIPGYPSYSVSSHGRVMRRDSGRILMPIVMQGYSFVYLSENGNAKREAIHRLVAIAFLGAPHFHSAQVAHNDGSRSHNTVANLRWATATENQADRGHHGTRVRGADVIGAKLTDDAIPEIRAAITSGERYPSIAKRYGVSISTISLIKRNRIWKHVQ